MTQLSVNINKIALIRNSRGRNFPDVDAFARRCLEFGAHGITLHPRQDQRHARYSDVHSLQKVCQDFRRELNVEGYPNAEFLEVVKAVRPAQCTLVPDAPGQLTSDHGWQIAANQVMLTDVIADLKMHGIRVSVFMDVDSDEFALAKQIGVDRVELYTEPYAERFHESDIADVLARFKSAAERAQALGLGVNAGHDLNLENLGAFLSIPNILEVSIGHALVVESLELGLETVIHRYVELIAQALQAQQAPLRQTP